MHSLWSPFSARSMAVRPRLSLVRSEAPWDTSRRTLSEWPCSAATWSGVRLSPRAPQADSAWRRFKDDIWDNNGEEELLNWWKCDYRGEFKFSFGRGG